MQSNTNQRQDQDSPPIPSPLYIDSQTERHTNSRILREFDELKNYAYIHGNYLLNDSQFQIFETTYDTSRTLTSILQLFTTPTTPPNVEAIKRLRKLQKANFQRANTIYKKLITPNLRRRMRQEHWPNQQDSPNPYPSIPSTSQLLTTIE
jgi:hypothetical protein